MNGIFSLTPSPGLSIRTKKRKRLVNALRLVLPQPVAPDEIWAADFERHEALLYRAVVKGHRLRPVAAGR